MSLFPTIRCHRPRRAALAAAALTAWLAACGGDDAMAPVITKQPVDLTIPEGGSGQVSVGATSDGGDIAYQWLDFGGNTDISGATAASLGVSQASLAIDGSQVQVRLTNRVGSVISDPAQVTVLERSWSAASPVLAGGARQFASIVDSNGHTHAVVINGNNLAVGVSARIKLAGADSTQAVDFAMPSGGDLQASAALSPVSTSIALAANRTGHVLAAWHRNGIVGAALYTPGADASAAGSWTLAPTRINSFASNSALEPAVAAAGDDVFEIAWRERIAPALVHDVMVRRYTISTNALGSPLPLESSPTETGAPRMVSDNAGNVLVAWQQTGAGVVINRRLAADAWTTATAVAETSLPFFDALRGNAQGKAVLVTSDHVGSATAVRLDLAAAEPRIGSNGVANAYGSPPDAMVAGDGRIHVFGVSVNTGGGNVSRLFHWTCSPSGIWSSAEAVSDINTADFIATGFGVYNPKVSDPDVEGNFIVAWQDRVAAGDNPLSHVSAARHHQTLDWRSTVALGDSNNQPLALALGASGAGTMVIGSSGTPAIQAMHFR